MVAVAKDDGAKAVPLGLEEPAVAGRQLAGELGQHGLDRRCDRKGGGVLALHQRAPVSRAAIRPSADFQPASNEWPG
jgi:hypothetical protein